MSDQDFNAGLSGKPFQPGMSLADYDRGVALRLGPKVEVSGVAYTLFLIAPMIWMVYPFLGLTLWAVAVGCYFLFHALHMPLHWGFLAGFILCVLSFIPGLKIEWKASQITVYRWFRNIIRYVVPFFLMTLSVSGDSISNLQITFKKFEPTAVVAGFFIALIAYLIYERLDLIYFPPKKAIKNLQEKIKKDERPTRSLGKRLFFGFCWFIPVMVVLTIIYYIVIRLFVTSSTEGLAVSKQYGSIVGPINAVIWYLLCLFGILPGTNKFRYTKEQEEVIKEMLSQK